MPSAVVGALRVTLGLDSAEFVQGMQAAQGRMAAMSKSFVADSRQVRDSAKTLGVSVGAMAREFGTLKALVDPAAVALQGYQQQAKLLREAMRLGVITQEQYKASVQAAHAAYVSAGKGVVASSGAQRAGMQQLGFQVSDLAVQMASGTDAMRAFALQGPQMVQAVALMAGTTGRFATFMAGPWGAALTAGTAILGALGVAYLSASRDGEKLGKSSMSVAEALGELERSTAEAVKALQDYNDAQKRERDNAEYMVKVNLALAEAKVKAAQATRQLLQAELERREADLRNQPFIADPEAAQAYQAGAAYGLRDVLARIGANKAKLEELAETARNLRITDARRDAEAAVDPIKAINNQYNDMADKAIAAASANDALSKSLKGTLKSIEQQRAAALDAQKATRGSSTGGGNASTGDMVALIKELFPGASITSTTGGRHKKGSDHYAGRAIDFVPAGGMGAMSTEEVRQRLLDAGVDIRRNAKGTEQFFGPGRSAEKPGDHDDHFHVAWQGSPSPERAAEEAQRAAEERARAETELGRLKVEQLALEADYTGNLQQIRDAELARINEDLASTERDLKLRDDISETMRQSLLAAEQANAEKRRELVEQEHGRRLAEQQFQLDQANLRAQIDAAGLRAELADTAEQRLKAELELFDLQEREREAQLRKVLATEKSASAAYQAAQDELNSLQSTRGQRRNIVARRNETPAQRYLRDVDLTAGEINEAIDGIKIDALDRLNDGLVDAITGVKSLGAVFRDISTQIVADLLRIAIRKAIIGPLADTLFGGGASRLLGGVLSPGGGIGGGVGTGIGKAVGAIRGAYAMGTNFHPGGLALVGEAGPEIVDLPRGSRVWPNGSGPSGVVNNYYTLPSDEFWSRVDGRAGSVVGAAAPAIAQGGAGLAVSRMNELANRTF